MTPRALDLVVPAGIADPRQPSGGNVYDLRLARGLREAGWSVRTRAVPGPWPHPGPDAGRAVAEVLSGLPAGSLVLVDGLVAWSAPDAVAAAGRRLRLVVLVHSRPEAAGAVGHGEEGAVLGAASGVVVTSGWTRDRLLADHRLPATLVHVAAPGVDVDVEPAAAGDGGRLLSVAAVTHGKGHDLLLDALALVADLPWHLVCVGPLDREPDHVRRLRRRLLDPLGGRVELVGPRTGAALAASYAAADVLVLASRSETYGMVVTEALARGLPVIATRVGGVPEALGRTRDGHRPGLLSEPGDVAALAGSLRRWLGDGELRDRLRDAAYARRGELAGWPDTVRRVARVLEQVAA